MASKKQKVNGSKKDFSKEAMYRKIMPSITATADIDDGGTEDSGFREDLPEEPGQLPYNLMELAVRSKLIPTMETLGACTCEQCRNDVIALALNGLPAVYSTSDSRGMKEKLRLVRGQSEIKITSALIRAIQTVMAEPHH
ncbi:late competence development ComFB family protein [Ruminococcaceae bacterium OttesenSCG-928-L11]|nr:late competence development ComFB family protein [Ruminococcaceae bacterium OttesenSCG-928-L11]